jgi:UDP-N-acetylmuramyl pentapeptide phosphotransferase/UDP-N-acetylglucosamine-1-phosphate transferase
MGLDQAAAELRGGLMLASWLGASLAIGAGGTWLARRYALRHHLLDAPGERRAHTAPTPRGGGVGIVVAMLLAGVFLGHAADDRLAWGAVLLGFTLVAGIGLWDDHRSLSPLVRLAVQALAAALLAWACWRQTGEPGFALLAFVLAMGLTNAWNFMDGIDGIAATQAVLVAGAVAVATTGIVAWWAWALVGATLGFLPFNFPKARIFLGDVGSGAMGFALTVLLMHAVSSPTSISPWLWALPPSAFLIDSSLTLAGRVLRGEAWWRPHALHAYQKWARERGSHVAVTIAYVAFTACAIACMFAASRAMGPMDGVLIVVAAWYIAGAGIWWALQRRPEGKGVAR